MSKTQETPQVQLKEGTFGIRAIVDMRTNKGKKQFCVQWADSWIPESQMLCPELLKGFLAQRNEAMPKKISQLNSDDKKGEFGVELIVDMRVTRGKREFLVKWDNTWVQEPQMLCPDLLMKFLAQQEEEKDMEARRPLSDLRQPDNEVQPPTSGRATRSTRSEK